MSGVDAAVVRAGPHPRRPRPRAYISLLKTRIAALVVVATGLGVWLAGVTLGAAGGLPAHRVVLALFATGLACLGAGVLNNVVERDIDRRMQRTRHRVTATGEVSPAGAAAFGVTLVLVGCLLLERTVGWLPALLALASSVLYVAIYTPLKRLSWWNTPVGAVPGAIPPLIGWAAVTGGLELGAWLLFLLLFVWQLPHFYAIAWTCREDFARAGLRMASGEDPNGRFLVGQVILSAAALLPAAGAIWLAGLAGVAYLAGAVVLTLLLNAVAARFARDRSNSSARALLRATILYLPALLAVLAVDRALLTTLAS